VTIALDETTTEEQLALPSGAPSEPAHRLNLAVLLTGCAVAMVFGAWLAAYLNVRALARVWPPKGVDLDNYLGVMLFVTLLMSAATVEWAPYALKRGNQRQALSALAVTIGFGVAFLNLAWYTGSQFGFGPADHTFGTLAWAGLIAAAVNVGLGIGFLLVALARTAGHQIAPGRHELARAAAWYWQFVGLTWLVVFTGLYVLQHR
jgi:heme/copper-type cytochrome/quinol oxidase subunit 3